MRKLNVTDGQTDGRTDGQTGGVAISPVPGPTAPAGDKNHVLNTNVPGEIQSLNSYIIIIIESMWR